MYFTLFGLHGGEELCILLSLLETHQPAGTEAVPPMEQHHALSHVLITRLLYIQRRMHSAYLCFALRVLADLCVCAVFYSLVRQDSPLVSFFFACFQEIQEFSAVLIYSV